MTVEQQKESAHPKGDDTCPLQSLHNSVVFSARDWSVDPNDAWIYAIVVGWGSALEEIAVMHGWQLHTDRIRRLHKKFQTL